MARALIPVHGPRIGRGILSAPSLPDSFDRRFDLFSGGHPLPNEESVRAGRAALSLAADAARAGSPLVVLLSGGASALLAAPAEGVSLDDKIDVSSALLRAGTAIAAFNAVRKHLSAIKGGQLGAHAGRSVTFAISDVHAPVEDDPAVIGSGPTVPDATTFRDAQTALEHAGIVEKTPAAARARIDAGVRGEIAETIKPGDPRLAHAAFVIAGGRRDALAGAEAQARALGYDVEQLEPPTLGEARDAGRAFVARAAAAPSRSPRCLLAAGETTVTVRGGGRGGRNQEFVLGAVDALAHLQGAALASLGTDGIDGPTDAAGAVADSSTLARARAAGLDVARALADNDAYPFFRTLGDLIVTGPTGTNVGDLQILVWGLADRA
jgi:glycerate 2-kinase